MRWPPTNGLQPTCTHSAFTQFFFFHLGSRVACGIQFSVHYLMTIPRLEAHLLLNGSFSSTSEWQILRLGLAEADLPGLPRLPAVLLLNVSRELFLLLIKRRRIYQYLVSAAQSLSINFYYPPTRLSGERAREHCLVSGG